MKVAWIVPRYLPDAPAGAEWTAHEFLLAMQRRGHDVMAIITGPEALRGRADYRFEGVPVRHDGTKRLALDLHEEAPDVVIGHLGYAERVMDLGADAVRVWMSHSEYQYAWGAAAQPNLEIANSEHVQHAPAAPLSQWGTHLLRPHTPCYRYYCDSDPAERPYVTIIGTSALKGIRTFRKVMDRAHGRKYLAVRGAYDHQTLNVRERGRLTVTHATPNPDRIYDHTRVLLVPSREESWGRVAVEAGHAGIPTIAHPTSGVVEAMGAACRYADRDDTEAWLRHLRDLDDPEFYASMSQAAERRAHANEVSTHEDALRLIDALQVAVDTRQGGGDRAGVHSHAARHSDA